MELNELPDLVDDEFTYPITAEAVIETIGDRTVDAPNGSDSEDLATILDRAGETTFETSDELITTIRGTVSDEYIGRKYYDDRGSNPPDGDDSQESSDSF